MSHYYHLCRRNLGRGVMIRTKDGRSFRGRIRHVTPTHVLISPMGRGASWEGEERLKPEALTLVAEASPPEGEEILWWGWWIPFWAIAFLTFLPFFFWW